MTLLSLAFVVALLLGWTLLRLLRNDDGSPDLPYQPFGDSHPNFIAESVFSPRDWLFIQKESSPSLNSLFIHERRAIAIRWLRDCLASIRIVRANHLRLSRHSQDLNVLSEAKLLTRFFYLSALCRSLLLIIRFVHPSVPYSAARYVQHLASTVLPSAPSEMFFSRVPVREVSRERLG